jgi:hypothetical protein
MIRLCVHARKINQDTIPDRERTPPIPELLSFIRILKLVLIGGIESFIVFYVDDCLL